MKSSSKWMTLGSAIFGVGALAAVSWLIYAIQNKASFWSWPGVAGLAIGAVGLACLFVGFAMPDDDDHKPAQQHQRAGSHSVNLQAGGDIRFGSESSDE